MGLATDVLDRTGIDSKKVKWSFIAFLSYLVLNIIGITDNVPILKELKISTSSSTYSWIYGVIIIAYLLLIYEDAI